MRNKILILLFASACADFLGLVLPKTCPDEDIAAKCEIKCEIEYVDCTLSCSDTTCLIECGRALTDCSIGCPCNVNCPNGCNDCPNPICVCGKNSSPQNEDNQQACMEEKSIDLGQCIIDCKGNQSCEQACVNLFKVQYEQCPCQSDCPFGCPCDSYQCQPDKNSVLVLNTYSSSSNKPTSNKPVLIKFDGNVEESLEFTFGPDTSAYYSCSATLNGEFFVLGGTGNSQNKQISKIVDCTLERIGDLPNEFYGGACGTFLFGGEERVMFCFPGSDKKKCFSYNGKTYTNHPNSVHDHYKTSLGNIDNKVLAVGSEDDNTEVELFDINSNKWTTKKSFPFCKESIYQYGIISRKSSVLIFGGACHRQFDPIWDPSYIINAYPFIARYTIDSWKEIGILQYPRQSLRTIANGDRIYVVGGEPQYGPTKTEIWSLDENEELVNMKIAEPNLINYKLYPELFIVDSDFCTKK